ncbi:hypothetical protein D6D01_10296 [Aureobasidium pullulans]|uniref:Uncharacterized protein n=1 Tax=Aureobasidium pullulans TaxID=5580 RepID=A0A4S9JLX8_AURPU|nr:hypothetical protein D6D01_10296 [Aureobasidium pullulans]
MQSTRAEPYLTAELRCDQTEFDLSGATRFKLTLAITLHARAPVLICEEGTFIQQNRALEDIGIFFTNRDTGELHTGSYVCRIYECGPPTTPQTLLEPGKTVLTNIQFNGYPEKIKDRGFDMMLIFNTAGFETGCTFEGQLPAGQSIRYWRWASSEECGPPVSSVSSTIKATVQSAMTWWNGDQGHGRGASLPLEMELLPIYIEGDGVVFTCVGKKIEMPARDSMVWDHNKPGYKEQQERERAKYAKKNAKKRAAVEESNRKFRVRMAAERKARGEAPWPSDQVSEESHERYLERKAAEEKAKEDVKKDAAEHRRRVEDGDGHTKGGRGLAC